MTDHELDERFKRIEQLLTVLVDRQTLRDYYEIDSFAKMVGRTRFTVREWARLGRIHAEKRRSGRGPFSGWVIAHKEYLRYQRDGLLPVKKD